jgi:hypothetical protein
MGATERPVYPLWSWGGFCGRDVLLFAESKLMEDQTTMKHLLLGNYSALPHYRLCRLFNAIPGKPDNYEFG